MHRDLFGLPTDVTTLNNLDVFPGPLLEDESEDAWADACRERHHPPCRITLRGIGPWRVVGHAVVDSTRRVVRRFEFASDALRVVDRCNRAVRL